MPEQGRRGLLAAALLALLLALPLLSPGAAARESDAFDRGSPEEVLRVGFPIQTGLTELDEAGNYTGYTFDYLEEIAQYTGWSYEFVTLEGDLDEVLTRMLEMLRDGELDLLGAMTYSEGLAELYDYPGVSYGTAYSVLAVPEENTAVTEGNLPMVAGLRIAVAERAENRNAELERYCSANHLRVERIPCADERAQEALVRAGGADALLTVELAMPADFRVVAKFAPQPFYFATTRGNSSIVTRLNTAILKIGEADPYFAARLYDRYFGASAADLTFTDEERAYLERSRELRVAYVADKAPIQYRDPETGEPRGITRDVFDGIAAKTGLSFAYVPVESQEDLVAKLASGQVDLLAGIPYDHDMAQAYHVALTRSYLTTQLVMAVNKGVTDLSDLSGRRLALPRGVSAPADQDDSLLTWYDSVEACVAAVDRGEADYAYGNGYTVQYYAARPQYRNVVLVPWDGRSQSVSIGVSKPVDVTLLTILNKAVLSMDQAELQAIVYRNIVRSEPITLRAYLTANPGVLLPVVAALAVAVILVLLWFLRVRGRFSRTLAAENERYRQLCELSNEYIFEYDYEKDRLTMTESCARQFGLEQVEEGYLARHDPAWRPWGDLGQSDEAVEEFYCTHWDGVRRWYRLSCKLTRDGAGRPKVLAGKLSDIQDERTEREALMERARRDSLTGVYNAATIRQLVTQRLAEEAGRGALLLVDIDCFKSINDSYGHIAGDKVIQAVARSLTVGFRRDDLVGRPGGDEFLIYMARVEDRGVVEEKCRALLDAGRALGAAGADAAVTLSIGAVMADGCRDYDTLYHRADQALYAVKNGGRNGFAFA